MALVLVFSVQGIAEAQSVSVSGDGSTTSASSGTTVITDYRDTPNVERSFTIRVSSAKNGENVTIGPTGATLTEVEVTSAPSPQTKFDNGDDPDSDTPTSSDAQIAPAKGVISGDLQTITFNGLGKPDSATATGSWAIKVTYQVTAFGQYRIEIGGTVDSDVSGSPITAYVVRSDTLSRNASIAAGSTTTPVLGTGSVSFTVAPATQWTRVDLKVTGGKLYLDSGQYLSSNKLFDVTQRKEFTSLSMFTGSDGSVTANLIQNSGQVAKVTATIPGSNTRGKTYTVTSFASAITVEQVSGNHQFGYTNQGTNYGSWEKLQNALVVRVVDGHQTNKGVQGQWVRFTTRGTSRLRAVSRALLWDSSADGSISAVDDNQTPLIVKTDGSGRASVYLLPGTSADTYTVTYAVVRQNSPTAVGSALTGAAESSQSAGAINEQFTATAIQDPGDTRDYVIDKGDSTETPKILRSERDTELKVKVKTAANAGNAPNVQVDFSVNGGRITLTPGSNYGTSLSTVTDSVGDARVWVQASGNSVATVTARIAGNTEDAGRYVVTFLRSGAYIEYVSGDDQDGAVGGRLEDPLVVRVLDGEGGSPIPNQIVRFNVTADGNDHSSNLRQFIPVPGTYVFVTVRNGDEFDDAATRASDSVPDLANALHPTAASNGQNIFIQTDSSGEAQVYFRLGSADDTGTTDVETVDTANFETFKVHRVTATTPGTDREIRFRADAVKDARQAKLEIVSGDGQSADKGDPLAEPLVVRVRTVRGFLLAGVLLEFVALDGTLLVDPDHDTQLVSESGGGNQIEVRTGSDGEARVDYNVGQLRIARDVTVEVVKEQGTQQYDFAIDEVRFGVNGRAAPDPDPAPAPAPAPRIVRVVVPPAEPRLIIEPASIVGTPSSEHEITIRAEDEHGVAVSVPSIAVGNLAFEQAGGSFNPGRTITPITGTLVLPNTPQRYEISAAAKDYKTAITSVRVAKGTLEITVPSEGAPWQIRHPASDGDRPCGATTPKTSRSRSASPQAVARSRPPR